MNEREKTIRLWFDMWLNQQDMQDNRWTKRTAFPLKARLNFANMS